MMPNIVVCGLIAFYLKTPLFPSLSISTTPLPCSSASDLLIDLRYPSSPCQDAKTTFSFCYLPKLAFELTSPSSPSLSSAAAPSLIYCCFNLFTSRVTSPVTVFSTVTAVSWRVEFSSRFYRKRQIHLSGVCQVGAVHPDNLVPLHSNV